jgi:C-terminal processing protease CtpA/Prc
MISTKKKLVYLAAAFLVVGAFICLGIYYTAPKVHYQTEAEKDVYVRFDMEAYDTINQNYWKDASSSNLAELFQFSLQKAKNLPALPILTSSDRTGVANMLSAEFKKATSTEARKQSAINTLIIALYNMLPQGRNELLSSAQEKQLRQTVANVNPTNDLYQNLGLNKDADQKSVDEAYQKKEAALAKVTSAEAKAELAKVSYAHKVLSDMDSKKIYDNTQIEPTVFGHIINTTLYLYINKISPTTFNEFTKAIENASTTEGLSNMIIDLRNNIGGDLSFPQFFLGLFLGQNQYAFDLYHQGDYQPQRTVTPKFPELDRYKEYAVITNSMTQSTAELLTAILKRANIAHVVGIKTRGWGSVENTYPLKTMIDPNEKYSLFLVNSLTLRDDNQPIEINGVLPDVDISDQNWKQKLPNYFKSNSFINTLIQRIENQPMQ